MTSFAKEPFTHHHSPYTCIGMNMAFLKHPASPREGWWKCGNQSPLSCGESSVVMTDEHGQPLEALSSPRHASNMGFGGAPGASYTIQNVRSLVHGIVSPFMNCVTPPVSMCMSQQQDLASWQQQNEAYPVSRRGELFIYMPASTDSQQSSHKAVLKSPSLPLINIETCHVHCNDILCGRGTTSTTPHVGNRNFRELIAANRDAYASLTRKQKLKFARSIVDLIHSTRPAGRFLMRDSTTGLWNDIGMTRSIEKTAQALREDGSTASEAESSPAEDRSVAPTAASESLASASTTPASNNSHKSMPKQQIVVPSHLRHVYTMKPAHIPSFVLPKAQGPHQAVPSTSDLPKTVDPSFAIPGHPISPTLSETHSRDDQIISPQDMDSEPMSSIKAPSTPPAIWRIRNSPVSSLPDIVQSYSTIHRSNSSEVDSLKQLQSGHTLVKPSIEKVTSDEWNETTTPFPRQWSDSDQEMGWSEGYKAIQSTLSRDERVVGRERRSSGIISVEPSRLPLAPSSVSRHRHGVYH